MNAQSRMLVAAVLLVLLFWLLRIFFKRKLSAGQTLFWLLPLAAAEGLVLFPALIDRISVLWGNLVPVSWITFLAMVLLIFYLLYLTVRTNRYAKVVELARSVAYLEQRVRAAEARCRELTERLARPE